MTQYKVDVIGEQNLDKDFDEISEAFDHVKHLLEAGKKLEISVAPEAVVEAPVEGEGAPTSTDTQDTDDTDEPATDPKDADIDATDDLDEDDGELSGEELDEGETEDAEEL